MPRRREVPKREVLADPKYGSELISRFINRVMVNGKKFLAEKILYKALDLIVEKNHGSKAAKKATQKVQQKLEGESVDGGETGGFDSTSGGVRQLALDIFIQALENVKPTVEVRSRRVGGSTYPVPFEVPPKRRNALGMRWLVECASKRRDGKTMAERLAYEISDALEGRGGACEKKETTHKMAEANKAFSVYHW